ncbi:S-adenosylmethionine:tRNA ribosyltransferase-isomerase [Thalassoglobus neptunius]|uniref:S-adenosylmethionine:tRNA ribosyltransferase-isomerase n=1 Tax=Thalassoglobus neptunius TaxID=1938619 RepID=A0A5C5WNX7_9PLAN|nr:tRNA preQ1(34) S-adenosylmethionine ribosyltransferase-isomerase QueA [Thalassoglobus neptunius]TWT52307.1 S-adenosylmethionine:tRNA ribosyltransferase-isomerase [Thalassoglobus neptunius]
MTDLNSIHAYDYQLPEELIASVPADRRDASRLLVVDRATQSISHREFVDLPKLLDPGDLLVLNNTRVVPARIAGVRTSTGGKWEGLFLRETAEGHWRLIGQTRGHLKPGETLTLSPLNPSESGELVLQLVSKCDGGEWIAAPQSDESTIDLLSRFGTIPLPHYMQREAEETDYERYQTLYAEIPGAVAAPTAGLHFTQEVMESLTKLGVSKAHVTLHVGLGTFRPVKVDQLSEHEMHAEWCEIGAETIGRIEQTKAAQKRVVAIGTTSVRTLESAAKEQELQPFVGETNLFIRPPYEFQVVDALLTNFHLPKSTLLVLVSTFAGRELIQRAYEEAIRERYRFFSYGDAMLIL